MDRISFGMKKVTEAPLNAWELRQRLNESRKALAIDRVARELFVKLLERGQPSKVTVNLMEDSEEIDLEVLIEEV